MTRVIPPKPKYVKINRVAEKVERMDKFMDIIEQEKEISAYQLQRITGFGNGTFYNIGQAVLQAHPKGYMKVKNTWKVTEEPVKEDNEIMIDEVKIY